MSLVVEFIDGAKFEAEVGELQTTGSDDFLLWRINNPSSGECPKCTIDFKDEIGCEYKWRHQQPWRGRCAIVWNDWCIMLWCKFISDGFVINGRHQHQYCNRRMPYNCYTIVLKTQKEVRSVIKPESSNFILTV
jgi:hypothetical protein